MKTLLLVSLALILSVSVPAFGQERQRLELKKRQLEEELAKINERLESIERASSTSLVTEQAGPGHFIDAYGIYDVNSAGGVEPSITLRNPNARSPIKYARIAVQLFDRVGKLQNSSIGDGPPTRWLTVTGPINFEDPPRKGRWDPIWYNHSGWCLTISQLQVEFLDGTKRSFSGKSLTKAFAPGLAENTCPVDGPRHREQ